MEELGLKVEGQVLAPIKAKQIWYRADHMTRINIGSKGSLPDSRACRFTCWILYALQ